jgi:hypothetical protein
VEFGDFSGRRWEFGTAKRFFMLGRFAKKSPPKVVPYHYFDRVKGTTAVHSFDLSMVGPVQVESS